MIWVVILCAFSGSKPCETVRDVEFTGKKDCLEMIAPSIKEYEGCIYFSCVPRWPGGSRE